VAIESKDLVNADSFAEAGADHLIVMLGAPFDLDPVATYLAQRA
jgi:hypothetical protein